MQSLLGGLLILGVLTVTLINGQPTPVEAESNISVTPPETLQPIKTQSRFEEKLSEISEVIPKKVVYKDDPETESGTETIIEEGEDGKKTRIIKTIFYEGKEYAKETVGTEITPAKDKTVLQGTKIIWKTLETPDGEIRYWKKLRVWATHYDPRCPGCNDWTAIGMRAGKGVIAVDPKVIKLRSKVYIPGYGMAVAGDTGGSIKGNIIDLGFDDARTAGWRAKFTDIYILN